MKKNVFSLMVLCIITMQFAYSQTATDLWNTSFLSAVYNSANIKYTLTCDGVSKSEPFNLDTVCSVVCTPKEMWHTKGQDGAVRLHITQDSFFLINSMADDITYGTVWKDSTKTEYSSHFNMLIYPQKVAWGLISHFLPLYFMRWRYSPDMIIPEEYYDTIWNGGEYWAFMARDSTTGMMVGTEFVPNDDTVLYFVNKSTNLVERVDVYSHNGLQKDEDAFQYERYVFHDIKTFDSIFTVGDEWRITSPRYAHTPKYNIYQHIPASLASVYHEKKYKMSDQFILDYPLIDPFGDTITIGEMDGWLLINLFSYGCPPCAEFHKRLQDESRANGACILEENGVRVVCIQPKTGLSDMFLKYVEKFGLQHRAYCARELGPFIEELKAYPTYILLSPNKSIALRGTSDYTKILDAKTEYEKMH